ncbi:hypothetical protein V1478_016029 [Vespula squamosa]|uniref:Uncharacterized protein n=1 Tax=Vespula squamosa TaxID=30214 RepID=A0ABD2A2L4_VESSQ
MKSSGQIGPPRHIRRKSDVRTTEQAMDFIRKLERQIGQRYTPVAKAKLLGADRTRDTVDPVKYFQAAADIEATISPERFIETICAPGFCRPLF